MTSSVPLPRNPTVPDRIAPLIDGLLRSVEARAIFLGPVLWIRIFYRVRRLQRSFNSLVARVQAGEPARIRASRRNAPGLIDPSPADPNPAEPSPTEPSLATSGAPLPGPSPSGPPAREPLLRLPTKFGWLCELVPYRAGAIGVYLANMLTTDAEMAALVSSDPRFGRILRPLFHMLGRQPPSCVPKLPPRVRKPRPVTPKAPRPIKQVTGRALLKYLPWKKPRPMPTIGPGGKVIPGTVPKTKA